MRHFINLYTKSYGQSSIPDKEYINASKELYRVFVTSKLAQGRIIPMEPKFVCLLDKMMSMPRIKGESFSKQLSLQFKAKTGKEWDADKYLLVPIPTQITGLAKSAVFEI
jgi:hypothetical protein